MTQSWDDHGVVVRTIGLMVLRRLVGPLGLGPSPDAKDVELAVRGPSDQDQEHPVGSQNPRFDR